MNNILRSINIMSNIFITNIEKETESNKYYRNVICTSKHQQLVLMNIKPKEDIEFEIHKGTDQFIRIEKGTGLLVIGNNKKKSYKIKKGTAFIIPSGTYHQIINISKKVNLKLYTIYSPPVHEHNHIDVARPK